jgi:molecular chaperone HscB
MFNESNYFKLLGIEQIFKIDQENLYQNYLKLQQILHPDKLLSKSNSEKLIAMEYASKINNAYEVLKDDKKRAEYLLYLEGVIINQEDGNNVDPSPLMLLEILEISENPLLQEIEQMQQECWDNFNNNYSKGDLQNAAQAIIKLQYLSKVKIS